MLECSHARSYLRFLRWPTLLRPALGVACLLVLAGCGEPLVPDPPPSPTGPSVEAAVASGPPGAAISADAGKLPSVKDVVEELTKPGCVIHYRTLSDLYAEYRVELEFSRSAREPSGRLRVLLYGVDLTVQRPTADGKSETLPKGMGMRAVCKIPDTVLGAAEARAFIEDLLREKGIDVAADTARASAASGPAAGAARLARSGVRELWRWLAPRPLSAAQSTTIIYESCETWADWFGWSGDLGINCTRITVVITCPFGFDYELSSGLCTNGTTSSQPTNVIASPSGGSSPGGPGTTNTDPGDEDDDDDDDEGEDEEDDEVPEGCGDARDGLALEYTERSISGSWPCTVFSKAHSDLIGVGTGGYHSSHKGYGYINPSLPDGIAKVEATFNISLKYTSGYRCPVRNAAVSTSADPDTSHHIFGQAVDFYTTTGWTKERKAAIHQWGRENAAESINYPPEEGNHNHLAWR